MAETPRTPEAAAAQVQEQIRAGHNPEEAVSQTLQGAQGGGDNAANNMMRQAGQAYERLENAAQQGVNRVVETAKNFAQEIGEALTPDKQ